VGKKVVLIDFWTYSCINCQRTLPYLKTWYDTYSDKGLEIISIHTPEFGFEKVQANVEKAATGFGLKYPIVLDNQYGTWSAFHNQYWPRKYLIDIDGYIVYDHAGEGEYDATEAAIQKALKERAAVLGDTANIPTSMVHPSDVIGVNTSEVGSPEIYFGSSRNEYLANGTRGVSGTQTFTSPQSAARNRLYLGGTWNLTPEFAEANAGSTIIYKYKAKNVYFVGSAQSGARIRVLIDGKQPGVLAGKDVSPDGTLRIQDNRLYSLVSDTDYAEHTLTIETLDAGLDAYTFTFG
jgi:thiol-disulfide isomerase/thioredoxin